MFFALVVLVVYLTIKSPIEEYSFKLCVLNNPSITLFLKSTWISSPTSARITGPRNPKCASLDDLFTLVVKVSSVYSTYTTFLYSPPILSSAWVKYFAESLGGKKRQSKTSKEHIYVRIYENSVNEISPLSSETI